MSDKNQETSYERLVAAMQSMQPAGWSDPPQAAKSKALSWLNDITGGYTPAPSDEELDRVKKQFEERYDNLGCAGKLTVTPPAAPPRWAVLDAVRELRRLAYELPRLRETGTPFTQDIQLTKKLAADEAARLNRLADALQGEAAQQSPFRRSDAFDDGCYPRLSPLHDWLRLQIRRLPRPNPDQDWDPLLSACSDDLLLCGSCYLWAVTDSLNQVAEVRRLPARETGLQERGDGRYVCHYQTDELSAKGVLIPLEDVQWVRRDAAGKVTSSQDVVAQTYTYDGAGKWRLTSQETRDGSPRPPAEKKEDDQVKLQYVVGLQLPSGPARLVVPIRQPSVLFGYDPDLVRDLITDEVATSVVLAVEHKYGLEHAPQVSYVDYVSRPFKSDIVPEYVRVDPGVLATRVAERFVKRQHHVKRVREARELAAGGVGGTTVVPTVHAPAWDRMLAAFGNYPAAKPQPTSKTEVRDDCEADQPAVVEDPLACPQGHHKLDGKCLRDYCHCQCLKCKKDCGEA